MEKLMKAQVDGMADDENKRMLQSALTGILKMREDLWNDFNDSLKVTLESKSIRAFRVEEALETPQEWDVMAILIQYLCPNTSDSAAADPYSASYAGENRNPLAPEKTLREKLLSWILARGTTVGNFAATVAELWLLTKVSEFFSKTAVPQIDTHIVNPTSSPKTKLPFGNFLSLPFVVSE